MKQEDKERMFYLQKRRTELLSIIAMSNSELDSHREELQLLEDDARYGITSSGLNLAAFNKAAIAFDQIWQDGTGDNGPAATKAILLAYVNG